VELSGIELKVMGIIIGPRRKTRLSKRLDASVVRLEAEN
jgi:hypothetical protein